MAEPTVAPYGGWGSPITSDLIVSRHVRLGQIVLEGGTTYWVETRPAEEGRNAIVRKAPSSGAEDVVSAPYNAHTRVHEYGGGGFTAHEGTVYFANFRDQRLYTTRGGRKPRPITPRGKTRYADLEVDARHGRLLCVREDHSSRSHEAVTTLVAVPFAGRPQEVLVEGNNFYAAPRLNPAGDALAWMTWNHPLMPWDGTELWWAPVEADGGLGEAHLVTGGTEEAICQPVWSPDGILHFVSDRSGWWNLYRWEDGEARPLYPMEAEFGRPHWVFGISTYGFLTPDRLVCAYHRQGRWHLAWLDLGEGRLREVETPFTEIGPSLQAAKDRVVFLGGSATHPLSVVELDPATGAVRVLRRSLDLDRDERYLSTPKFISFPTEEGEAHAHFYPPRNADFRGPPGERPPLLVTVHGGPTSMARTSLDLATHYWTSRGLAVVDVDYGGSVGYGRAYRRRLRGRWGVVDVQDCAAAARHLVQAGAVDGERLAIRGGSAGGFTTLAALANLRLFHAGASYYGVSDLEALARDTHKFESRYLDGLVGPYPEAKEVYEARSPLHHADRITAALILFQGQEDPVVPPDQSESMVRVLRERGVPVAYVPFKGEMHGFRRGESIKKALEVELSFYARVFGFPLAEERPDVPIENL